MALSPACGIHLASYENLITTWFPRRCCGIKVANAGAPSATAPESVLPRSGESEAARKARIIDEDDAAVKTLEEQYTGADSLESNRSHFQQELSKELGWAPARAHEVGWNEMRDYIFKEEDNMVKVMQYMQRPRDEERPELQRHRGYIYNWGNIYTMWTPDRENNSFKPFKPTLEFRQHPCCTTVEEVRHRVLLLEAVMRVAERKDGQTTKYASETLLDANMPPGEREGSKYYNGGHPYGTMREFVAEFLRLDGNEVQYWEAMYDKYKNDRPGPPSICTQARLGRDCTKDILMSNPMRIRCWLPSFQL